MRERGPRWMRYRAVLLAWSMFLVSACTSSSATPSASSATHGSPAESSSSSGAGITVSQWREVRPSPLAHLTQTYPPAWSGTRFVIAGHPLTSPPKRTDDVQLWTSPDGQGWSTSPVASKGYPLAYAFDGLAGVAVGSVGEQAAVWTSPDGTTWTRIPNPAALTLATREVSLALSDVAHGPAGYVALADLGLALNSQETIGQSLVMWSRDGHDWHRVPAGAFENSDLDNVVVVHGRYVISGSLHTTPTLWTSLDGRLWAKEPALEHGPSTFIALAAGTSGALLTGLESGSGISCVQWSSSDGLTWTRINGGCPTGVTDVVAAPFGFVASTPKPAIADSGTGSAKPTISTSLPCAGGIEVSTTGERWICVPPPPSVSISSVAASQSLLLITGFQVASPNALGIWLADVRIEG
jgi:hypothetical protein